MKHTGTFQVKGEVAKAKEGRIVLRGGFESGQELIAIYERWWEEAEKIDVRSVQIQKLKLWR